MEYAAFRVDASLHIGTGHVMRCLTLAQALRQRGTEVTFISRELPGNVINHVESKGFAVECLPKPGGLPPKAPPAHAPWAGVKWQRDAEETTTAFGRDVPDWLVIDHYAFDERWEKAIRRDGMKIMVIDDLADRPHDCDLLLDQNLGREAANYVTLTPNGCDLLIGPTYALLRPQFAATRQECLRRRRSGKIASILVSMGGIDSLDATSSVLNALRGTSLPDNARIAVIMGSSSPALERVKALSETISWRTEVVVDVSDMAARMAAADLAIGSAGSTTWERCCLGLPTISVQTAANQSEVSRAIGRSGAALNIGPVHGADFIRRLQSAVSKASEPDRLTQMSERAAAICDGEGCRRVLQKILRGNLETRYLARPARMDDAVDIWRWRNEGPAHRFYKDPSVTPLEDHLDWFANALADPERILLIVEYGRSAVGHVRLDRDTKLPSNAEISIYVNPELRGRGHGQKLLQAALQEGVQAGISRFHAEIHRKNTASLHIFQKLGFRADSSEGPFIRFFTTSQMASLGQ